MFWFSLILLLVPLHASDDFSSIQRLDEKLPDFEQIKSTSEQFDKIRDSRKQISEENKIVLRDEIKKSGTSYGAIPAGTYLRDLESNKNIKVTKLIYVKYFNLEDEQRFKYLLNKDGQMIWKIRSDSIIPINEEMSLYVPPLKYTPAPKMIKKAPFDKKLSIRPEVTFSAGFVRGDYMKDLFNDKKALSGKSFHSGLHFFTHWKSPIKAGAVLNYERASYGLNDNQEVIYSSLSFGPQLKTKDFHLLNQLVRLQTQFRYGPLAKVEGYNQTFKLNSTDLLLSIEKPFKNSYGEFVLGLFTQSQWLNIRDQKNPVEIKSSNETNKTYGFSISQVFE